jgi:hypothetical protein
VVSISLIVYGAVSVTGSLIVATYSIISGSTRVNRSVSLSSRLFGARPTFARSVKLLDSTTSVLPSQRPRALPANCRNSRSSGGASPSRTVRVSWIISDVMVTNSGDWVIRTPLP